MSKTDTDVAVRKSTALSIPCVTLTATSAVVDEQISEEQFAAAFQQLTHMHGALSWWLGDLLTFGKMNYRDLTLQLEGEYKREQRSLEDYSYVSANISSTVRTVDLEWSHHKLVAPLLARVQKKWLQLAVKNDWTVAEMRKELKAAGLIGAPKTIETPAGKYRVIMADPPWQYSDKLIEGYGAAEHHYQTLTPEQLIDYEHDEVRLTEAFADDSVLFLWATCPMLREALQVMNGWGYDYKAQFVWDKVDHNFGHYNSVRHELLLVGVRGDCQPDKMVLHDSVVTVKRGEHSEKPDEFIGIITKLYTVGPYLELFARVDRDGWTTWGNEA